MESFFLLEMLKYLYLFFDVVLDWENIVDGGLYLYLFIIEAYILSFKSGIGARDNRGRSFWMFLFIMMMVVKNIVVLFVWLIVCGGFMVMKNMWDDDELDKCMLDKFCLYYSLFW